MNTTDIGMYFAYNDWANQRILDQAAHLSSEQLLAPAAVPMGSLFGTLAHALVAEVIWRRRWQALPPIDSGDIESYQSFDALHARWQVEADALRAYVASVTDEDLQRTLHYQNSKGTAFQQTLWHLMAHMVNHGTQHRSEAAILLTSAGHSPGELDLIGYLRQ